MLESLTLRTADLVVCPSESSREWYARFRNDQSTISLENPVDVSCFRPDPSVERDIDVVFVGRLTPEKGADVLLDAVARLPRALRLVLIGQGTQTRHLSELAAQLPGECTIISRIDNDDLPRWYQRAKVVVVPSFAEAGPVVPLEAMACGTPVVASAVTGLVDLVDDGRNGWLVPPGDARALAVVLETVLADGNLLARAGKEARNASARMDLAHFQRLVTQVYRLGDDTELTLGCSTNVQG